MSKPMKFDSTAIALELIPATVQAGSIILLSLLTRHDSFQSLVAVILCLIWLTVSKKKMAEQFGELRLRRHLFSVIGNWMNRSDAGEEFDRALSRYLMIEGGIENDDHKAVATAASLANNVRGMVSFAVYAYLAYFVATALLAGQMNLALG